MFGPIEGRRHDAFMLAESHLTEKLERLNQQNGKHYIVYGDPAYGVNRNILSPLKEWICLILKKYSIPE